MDPSPVSESDMAMMAMVRLPGKTQAEVDDLVARLIEEHPSFHPPAFQPKHGEDKPLLPPGSGTVLPSKEDEELLQDADQDVLADQAEQFKGAATPVSAEDFDEEEVCEGEGDNDEEEENECTESDCGSEAGEEDDASDVEVRETSSGPNPDGYKSIFAAMYGQSEPPQSPPGNKPPSSRPGSLRNSRKLTPISVSVNDQEIHYSSFQEASGPWVDPEEENKDPSILRAKKRFLETLHRDYPETKSTWDENCSLVDIKYEFAHRKRAEEETNKVFFMKTSLKFILKLVEVIGVKYGLRLTGWVDSLSEDDTMSQMDKPLRSLYYQHFRGVQVNPMMELFWILAGSAVMFHLGQRKSSPGAYSSRFAGIHEGGNDIKPPPGFEKKPKVSGLNGLPLNTIFKMFAGLAS